MHAKRPTPTRPIVGSDRFSSLSLGEKRAPFYASTGREGKERGMREREEEEEERETDDGSSSLGFELFKIIT